jgi:hypothetical protein
MRKLTILSIFVVVVALVLGCGGGEETGPVVPEPNATLTGSIEISEGASSGTISLTISGDGASLTSISVTLSNLQCDGFSAGSMTKTAGASISITEGNFHGSVTDIGEIDGEFTSSTEANGTISLMLEIPYFGTCDLGTWNWSAQKTGAVDITGTWNGEWWRSDGGEEGTLIATLTQSGSLLSGDMTFTSTTFSYSRDTTVSGSVQGNEVVFGTAIGGNGTTVTIDYEGTVAGDGDQMSGTYSMSTGYTGTWSAQKSGAAPDHTPPTITNISATDITETTATITWTTNDPSTSQVEYGETPIYGATTSLQTGLITNHSVTLTNLNPETTYHFRVKSKDSAANEATSGDRTFTTLALPDTTPPVISGVAVSEVTESSAIITWTTDEPATSQVEYGETTSYGLVTALDVSLVTNHSITLDGLNTDTTYHFRVKSKDASGNERASVDHTLTTLVPLDLGEAMTTGAVQANITGDGLTSITVELQSMTSDGLGVLIVVGTIFEAQSGDTQSMVVTATREALLLSYGSTETITVPVACVDMNLGTPHESDTFTIRSTPAPRDLIKLLSLSDFFKKTQRVQQFAVWTITENPNCRSAYRGLTTGWDPFSGSGPSDAEMDTIQELFEKAGISTDKYPALGEAYKQATISQLSSIWDYSWSWGFYDLDSVQVTIRNDNESPMSIEVGHLVLDGKTATIYFHEVLLAGEEKTFTESISYITVVTPGEKTVSLEIEDDCQVVVCSYSTTVIPAVAEETEFQLTDWAVVDHYSTAALQLTFTTTRDVDLLLTNPDGMEADSERIYGWQTETYLDLADYREVPDSGEYTLTVRDGVGTTIATQTFNFIGTQLTISEVSLTWTYWEYSDEYWLQGMSFSVTNDGDLLAYVAQVRVSLDGKEDSWPMYENVLPSEKKVFQPLIYIYDIAPGDKNLTIELLDGAGEVIASYSATVTPSV